MTSASMEKDPLIFTLGAWGLVGLTGILALTGITTGQFISFLIWTAAVLLMLPPLRQQLRSQLPFLRNRVLKAILWFVLLMAGFMFIASNPSVSALELCSRPQQNACTSESPVTQNQPKLYISGKQTSVTEGTEFTVNLKPVSAGASVSLNNSKVKAKVKDETFLLELEPGKLPAGTYQVSLSSDGKVKVPEAKEFTVWAGEVTNLKLCNQLQKDSCGTETTAFVENDRSIYLSGDQNQLADGTEFLVNLSYTSEPKKETPVKLPPVKAKVKDQQVVLELQPQALPIGSYELSVASNDKVKVSGSKSFTVWSSSADVKALTNGQWSDSPLVPDRFTLCDRTNAPDPRIKELEAAKQPESNEPIDETKAEEKEAQRVTDNEDFCKDDSDRFSSNTKALGFRLVFDPVVEKSRIKIMWRADGELITKPKIAILTGRSSSFTYTLASPDGFPPGNYEVIVALEAKNAKPIYRKFKVE